MGANTSIEWTRGDDGTPGATWNPVSGCTKVSPGCDHCYAERVTERFHGPGSFAKVQLHPDRLDMPLRWRKPRKVFVNSMSDLFHDDVPDEFIARVFAVMALAGQHTFQVLTKRHGRMRSLLDREVFRQHVMASARETGRYDYPKHVDGAGVAQIDWPLRNVWIGVSVETQQWADIRIPALLETPAAVRFLSCEPLLGPLNLQPYFWSGDDNGPLPGVDWVIVGGESGPGARPMNPQWARDIRDQCTAVGVPFLLKQWGEWVTEDQSPSDIILPATSWRHLGDDQPSVYKVGKKAAGRELDGRTWDEYPAVRA